MAETRDPDFRPSEEDAALLERLRSVYRDAPGRADDSGPDEGSLVELALENLEGGERERLADAVVASAAASEKLQTMLRVRKELEGELSRARPRQRSPWWSLSLAAAAIVLLFLAVRSSLPTVGKGVLPFERGSQRAAAVDDAGPPTVRRLDRAPERLEWNAVAEARSYRALLFDEESTPIWSGPPIDATSIELPPEVREQLIPGRTYLWRVEYRLGLSERTSPLWRFEIASE